jgi:hypothetical protein
MKFVPLAIQVHGLPFNGVVNVAIDIMHFINSTPLIDGNLVAHVSWNYHLLSPKIFLKFFCGYSKLKLPKLIGFA